MADSRSVADAAGEVVSDRVVAYLIDFVLMSVVAFVVWLVGFGIQAALLGASGGFSSDPSAAAGLGALLVRLVVWTVIGLLVFGYFTYLDASGGSLGKRFKDLAVRTEDGAAAGMKATAIRTAILLLPLPAVAGASVLLSWLGFGFTFWLIFVWLLVEAAVLFVPDGNQRLGDRLAGTYVVAGTATGSTTADASADAGAAADA